MYFLILSFWCFVFEKSNKTFKYMHYKFDSKSLFPILGNPEAYLICLPCSEALDVNLISVTDSKDAITLTFSINFCAPLKQIISSL